MPDYIKLITNEGTIYFVFNCNEKLSFEHKSIWVLKGRRWKRSIVIENEDTHVPVSTWNTMSYGDKSNFGELSY